MAQSKGPVRYRRAHARERACSLAGRSCVAWVPAAASAVRPLDTATITSAEFLKPDCNLQPQLCVTVLTAWVRGLSHSPGMLELYELFWGQQGQLCGTWRESDDSGTARRGEHT